MTRLNEEHPPLPKVLAALPLVLRGTHADYSHISWTISEKFFSAYMGQWVFGEWLLTKWNNPVTTLAWARLPMLLLTLALGCVLYVCARRLGGNWGGLLCLSVYVSMPAFLAFGPLVHTDIAVTLFSLLALWRFAEIWQNPTRKNGVLFGLSLAGALLSKFAAGILFFVFVALPSRSWLRRGATAPAAYAAVAVPARRVDGSDYREPTDVHSGSRLPARRLVLLSGSVRAEIPSGLSRVVGAAAALALKEKGGKKVNDPTIPAELAIHWRVLSEALAVFTGFCLLSRLDLSIRHFSVPLALLMLILAAGVLALSCLFAAVRAYPNYFPYMNVFSFGHPAYALMNDSNLDWNQSLPEVKRFADQHGLQRIDLDPHGFNDPAVAVPQAQFWDCQKPTAAGDGQWAVVSATMIMDDHNCVWLMQ